MNSARPWVRPSAAPWLSWSSTLVARSRTRTSPSRTKATLVPSALSFGSISGPGVSVIRSERAVGPLEQVQVAAEGDDGHLGLAGPDDLGDPGLAEPLPLATEGFLAGHVGVGVARARRPGDHAGGAAGDLGPPEDPAEAGGLGLEVGHGRAVGREGEGAGDDRPGRGQLGGHRGVDRLPPPLPRRFGSRDHRTPHQGDDRDEDGRGSHRSKGLGGRLGRRADGPRAGSGHRRPAAGRCQPPPRSSSGRLAIEATSSIGIRTDDPSSRTRVRPSRRSVRLSRPTCRASPASISTRRPWCSLNRQ